MLIKSKNPAKQDELKDFDTYFGIDRTNALEFKKMLQKLKSQGYWTYLLPNIYSLRHSENFPLVFAYFQRQFKFLYKTVILSKKTMKKNYQKKLQSSKLSKVKF